MYCNSSFVVKAIKLLLLLLYASCQLRGFRFFVTNYSGCTV